VWSEDTESWGPKSVVAEFEIPALELASFATDPDGR
jgi:hypothetical protein